jgi:di/tricarboxylate transporter
MHNLDCAKPSVTLSVPVSSDQILLFSLLGLLFALLIWGRWRYDLIAFSALLIAVTLGLVPVDGAFDGFGHPATVVIALVLIISRGLSNSGVVEFIAEKAIDAGRAVSAHIGIMSVIAGALSAVMNNVAALALLMPVDIQAATKAKRSPAISLMPLSFASILGGLITLIGTPPNIIIATFRGKTMGEPFSMFDFAPVGAACAVAGILFVALIGWRLIPAARTEHDTAKELFELKDYIAKLKVANDADFVGNTVAEWVKTLSKDEVQVLGLMRGGQRLPGRARRAVIRSGDILIVEASPEALEKITGVLAAEQSDNGDSGSVFENSDLKMREVVVPPGVRIDGSRSNTLEDTLHHHGVSLLGISRRGQRSHTHSENSRIRGGDILLLVGAIDSLDELTQRFSLLPLAERGLEVIQRRKAGLAVGIFVAAIALASVGTVGLPIALGGVAALFAIFNIVPIRDMYSKIEWSVIVLLGSLIPIGSALESSGATGVIVDGLLQVASGQGPVVLLVLLMVVTMTLSDVLNNTATAVIAAPIAFDLATRLGVNPDPYLMAVAVAASCAFLTPIGHKNNTLILGPGGYKFGDYWRMGLPLEVIVIVVAVPMILLVWPLT